MTLCLLQKSLNFPSFLPSFLFPQSRFPFLSQITMSAQATFFYGVYVKSAYLCFASDAYKDSKNSLLAIDLICVRRRKGDLSFGGGRGIVGRVPEEVWKMIKVEIVDVGTEEAEQRVIGDFWDSGCPCCCDDRIAPSDWEDVAPKMLQGLGSFWEYGGVAQMVSSRSKVRLQLYLALSVTAY